MKLRRLMQNCPSRTKPTKGQRRASQQKLCDDVADGSLAAVDKPTAIAACPLCSGSEQTEDRASKSALCQKQTY
jgi:hypothetical protein